MYKTELELVNLQQTGVLLLEKQIEAQHLSIEEIPENIPGYLHFNRLDNFGLINASPDVETFFELTTNEIISEGNAFVKNHFHQSTLEINMAQLIAFFKNSQPAAVIGQFQKIRKNCSSEYCTFIGFTKICPSFNCFLTVQNPVEIFGPLAVKLNRLVDDNEFVRENYLKFQTLTKREIEILRMVAYGKSRNEIANSLHISKLTFDNHRKSIRQKLEIKSAARLYQFIQAFDLY